MKITLHKCEQNKTWEQPDLQGAVACWAEYDKRVTRHLVDNVNQVDLLQFEGDEQVVLQEFVNRLVLGAHFNFDGV